jgi:hypothetical protein
MTSSMLSSESMDRVLKKFRKNASRTVVLICLLSGVPFSFPAACQSASVDVKSFGARCDGYSDDTPAIQTAIDHISAAGGGTVRFPATCTGPYYLNSFTSSRVDGFWTYNLLLPSNVTLQGEPGVKLLQGPHGTSQKTSQVTAAIGVGPHPGCYSSSPCNGGWYALKPFAKNDPQITLTAPGDALRFKVDDSVFVAASTKVLIGGVLTGEPNIVSAVDANTGELRMKYPLSRAFPSPSVANTTGLSTRNIAIKNLIIQAWCPLGIYNAFDIYIENNTFIVDQNNRPHAYDLDLGAVRQLVFKNNIVYAATSAGHDIEQMQMPMQSSYDLTWDGNTFYTTGWNFGSEFTAHEKITNNHIWISGTAAAPAIVAGGEDVVFSHNDVHAGTENRIGRGLLTDYFAGGDNYLDYSGELRIEDNTIDCTNQVLSYCVLLHVPGTVLSGNHISAVGNAVGIVIKAPKIASNNGAVAHNLTVAHNTVTVQQGVGITVIPSLVYPAKVEGNQINTMGADCIRVTSSPGDKGEDIVSGNMSAGCQIPVRTETSSPH